MLPSAGRSPQPKRYLDRFSRFCTAHGTVSSGMPGHVLSPKIAPSHAGFRSHLIRALLNPPESITQTVSRSLQPFFAQLTAGRRRACRGLPSLPLPMGYLDRHLKRGPLCPPDLAFHMASRSVSRLCTVLGRQSLYFTMGRPPLPMGGSGPPYNTWFLGPGPPEFTTQTAPRSVQPFLQSSRRFTRRILPKLHTSINLVPSMDCYGLCYGLTESGLRKRNN